MRLAALPKAELHCHLEGAIAPELVRALADRNGVQLNPELFDVDGFFRWHDFDSFLVAFDRASHGFAF